MENTTTTLTEDQLNQFRPLPESYSVDDFYHYTLHTRGKFGVIYEGRIGNGTQPRVFEVFKIKILKATILRMGKDKKETFVPRREKIPSGEDFGKWAWSVTSLERALALFNDIENTPPVITENEPETEQ